MLILVISLCKHLHIFKSSYQSHCDLSLFNSPEMNTTHLYGIFCLKICSARTSWFLILLGHYLYVEMDHGKHLDAGILESPIFPAPDASLWNSSSLIYGKCQVSPQYWTFFSQSYKRWSFVVQFCSHQINFLKVRVVQRPSFKFYLINIVQKLSTICLILLLIILNKKCL